MGPDSETTITPANLAMARSGFEAARDRFALAYARGANMFSFIRDRLTGRPDEAVAAAIDLRTSTLRLAEYEGRGSVVSGTIPGFRAEVALGAARAHQESQDDVVVAATEAVQTPGAWTAASRVWSGPEGDGLKVITTVVLAGASYVGLGYGNSADIINHAAVAAGAVTAMDLGRRMVLAASTRNADGLTGRIAELVRRKASVDEGTISGDVFPEYFAQPAGQVLSGEIEDRTEDALVEALYANDVQRPPLTRYDADWTLGLRTVIGDALRRFDQVPELVRSRDIAVRSRLLRTVLALGVAAGVTGHYFLTRQPVPEVRAGNCPIISFPDLNEHTRQSAGLAEVADFSGIAKDVFFINAFGVPYDHSENHRILLENLINENPAGNQRILNAIVKFLKEENPQLDLVTPDKFKIRDAQGRVVNMVGICDARQLQDIYKNAVRSLDAERS